MLEFPGPIPLRIHPYFWIFAALIGWLNSGTLLGMFVWIGIILVSVIFHELGHALTAVSFKQRAQIQLIAMGGLTSFEGPKLKFWQQFLITLNGPLFGFFLYLGATWLLTVDFSKWPLVYGILRATQLANLFWTVVNLLPVLPLDGGQLLRILLEASFGVKGFKASLLIGAIVAALLSFYFFLTQGFLLGAFFFLFAFQSFDSWRKSRAASSSDREESNKQMLVDAENALAMGKKEEAKRLLEALKEKAKGGLLEHAASQYLAFLALKEGHSKEAFDLLFPIQEYLAEDSLCLLHKLAADLKNYPLVRELSAKCYQFAPSQEMALQNARAFAHENLPKPAGGWLQTAYGYGGLNLGKILNEEEFQGLKNNAEFLEFIEGLE